MSSHLHISSLPIVVPWKGCVHVPTSRAGSSIQGRVTHGKKRQDAGGKAALFGDSFQPCLILTWVCGDAQESKDGPTLNDSELDGKTGRQENGATTRRRRVWGRAGPFDRCSLVEADLRE
eukprot:853838-Rhodomonas_salina.1